MKDKKVLLWIYKNSKSQILRMAVLIFTSIVVAVNGVAIALFSRGLVDSAQEGSKDRLLVHGFILVALFLLQFVLSITCKYLQKEMQNRLENCYKSYMMREYSKKYYSHLRKYHKGDILSRYTADTLKVSEGVSSILPDFAKFITKLISAFAALFILNKIFTSVFIAGGIVVIFVARLLRNRAKKLHKNVQDKDASLRSFIYELLENTVVIKVFKAEDRMLDKTNQLQKRHYNAKREKNIFDVFAATGFSFIFAMVYLYALVWNSYGLVHNNISFGTLVAILQLVGHLQAPFAGLSGLLPKFYGVLASAERIIEVAELPEEQGLEDEDAYDVQQYSDMECIKVQGVTFAYGEEEVLKNIYLTINKGDFTLVCGASGAGKSTLLMLLLGVYSPDKGRIFLKTYSNEKIDISGHVRKYFAFVPQKNMIFSGTVRENISFFKSGATDEEIMEAAKISCADEFINWLPNKLDTVIGENSQGLSEGQIQRLAIARAVLSGAPIVLLDEATSALDEITEKKVLLNLKKLTHRTFVFVSHKKTLSSLYNNVINIKKGKAYQKRYDNGKRYRDKKRYNKGYGGTKEYSDKKGYNDRKECSGRKAYSDIKAYSDKKGYSDIEVYDIRGRYDGGEKHGNRRGTYEGI
ncbi:ABC transporter ATP-binding protein [Acetivibrio saccincola]|mgnify:CR=1 FL=1|uniref:Putative ABC transporter ATP-binding protein n=1 Tax=Acetivibrio saccincola TaxID=1677857 RepID=A0A2K9EKT1_9FIRM|nr:ABC transporter ATP-binding protein [Acetivibrio saccincola]AUG57181.1 putative ABC transporter ATP-binding protein [Acetivibrio saccincola]NLW25994.1 ABC transporter ATP-binding protein [Acetivibrio saccincola]HOA96791.1 ABC transporter ATP-binding protein [Acetivibrio saccincola]